MAELKLAAVPAAPVNELVRRIAAAVGEQDASPGTASAAALILYGMATLDPGADPEVARMRLSLLVERGSLALRPVLDAIEALDDDAVRLLAERRPS